MSLCKYRGPDAVDGATHGAHRKMSRGRTPPAAGGGRFSMCRRLKRAGMVLQLLLVSQRSFLEKRRQLRFLKHELRLLLRKAVLGKNTGGAGELTSGDPGPGSDGADMPAVQRRQHRKRRQQVSSNLRNIFSLSRYSWEAPEIFRKFIRSDFRQSILETTWKVVRKMCIRFLRKPAGRPLPGGRKMTFV